MRRYLQEIEVVADARGRPAELRFQDRWWRVTRFIDGFRFGGRWWLGEAPRDYYLLELEGRLDVEVYHSEETWVLSRIQD